MQLQPGVQGSIAPQGSAMTLAQSLNTLASAGGVVGAPVVIKNNLPGIVTFTDENTRNSYQWEGKDDPHGRHIKEVSPTILANPQFREQVLRGIFTIVESSQELQNAIDAQRNHWHNRQAAAANAAAEIEKPAAVVIAHGMACIAPKGRELCGSYSLVMGNNPSEHPPLCQEHSHLAGQYAPTETGRLVDGKPEVIWKRVTTVAQN